MSSTPESAIGRLKAQLESRPKDRALRQQLAEVLAQAGRAGEAVAVLRELAADLAHEGRAGPAIAAVKRAESLDPGRAAHDTLLSRIGEALRGETVTGPAPGDPTGVTSPLFDDFSRDELPDVIRGLRLLVFEAGDVVVTEGEPGESLFVVTTGRVKAFVRQPSGRSALVRELGEGDFFGEISLLRGGRRTATITCATRCELLELDRATVDGIGLTHPNVPRVLQQFHDQRAGSTLEHMIRGLSGT